MEWVSKLKTNIKILEEERQFHLRQTWVAISIVLLFSAAIFALNIIGKGKVLSFASLVFFFTIVGLVSLAASTNPLFRSPTLKLRRLNARLKKVTEEVKTKEEYLGELQDSAYGLGKFVKREDIDTILEKIGNTINAEKVTLILPSGNHLVFAADWGEKRVEPGSIRISLREKSGVAWCFTQGKTLRTRYAPTDLRLSKKFVHQFGVREAIFIPLKIKEEAIGVLAAINKKYGVFNRFDIDYLNSCAYPLASAIQNAELCAELDRRLEMEQRFISDLAHHLKTPLTSTRGELELALQNKKTKKEKEGAIRFTIVSLDKISRTLQNVLQLAHLEARPQRKVPVEVGDILEEAFEVSSVLAQKKDLEFSFQKRKNIKVLGERDRILQAILCLLDNAIKYTPTAGKIDLKLRRVNNKAIITVSDTGFGIPKNDLERIFDRFWRGQAFDGQGGAGLGLSIAKSIIEAHQGEIVAKSEVGRGSQFIIRLPTASLQKSKYPKREESPNSALKELGDSLSQGLVLKN